jgi:DNA adenine methylase
MPRGPFRTYAEPFAGGAALFFHLASETPRSFERAILCDQNEDLVALYKTLKRNVGALVDKLRSLRDQHMALDEAKRSEHFKRIRDDQPTKQVERAARLLFLNKTCFNGLWRVNASGKFNVPFGRYDKPKILDVEALRAAHDALRDCEIVRGDYREVTRELREGDFAYFDPPYVPLSKTANFTAYAAARFDDPEQNALADEMARLHDRGVKAMLSNAATDETRRMYRARKLFDQTVPMPRPINSDPTKRGDVDELIVTTYEIDVAKRMTAS